MALDTTTGARTNDAEEVSQSGRRSPNTEPPAVAVEELLIDRPDIGPDCYTRVAAGDRIPTALLGQPYRPAAMLRTTAPVPRKPRIR